MKLTPPSNDRTSEGRVIWNVARHVCQAPSGPCQKKADGWTGDGDLKFIQRARRHPIHLRHTAYREEQNLARATTFPYRNNRMAQFVQDDAGKKPDGREEPPEKGMVTHGLGIIETDQR